MAARRFAYLALLSLAGASSGCGNADMPANPQIIELSAHQWAFTPNVLTVRQGTPVEIHVTSADVHHRFYLPEFGIDTDVLPNQNTNVQFTPDQAGTFHFRCEYYCGMGHEGMVGVLVVVSGAGDAGT